jgi:hypothetical protein
MTVLDLVQTHRPETWGREKAWPEFIERLWAEEHTYMWSLAEFMAVTGKWPGGDVIVDDGVVQDGHHRLVLALALGWGNREIGVGGSSE